MRASAAVNVWPLSLPGVLNKSMNYNETAPLCEPLVFSAFLPRNMFDFSPRAFSKQEMDFVESVFNVKWGAIKSFDCDIYAKVWLGSPLFVFFSSLSPFFLPLYSFCL